MKQAARLRTALSCAAFAIVFGVVVSPAQGAFAGRDGLLVVQPFRGRGLVSLGLTGGVVKRLCTDARLCGHPVAARWSPDGREIVFDDSDGSRIGIIGAAGGCLWCLSGDPLSPVGGAHAAFTPSGTAVTFVGGAGRSSQGLWRITLGAHKPRRLLGGAVSDAVWSSRGGVAVVRAGAVWVGQSVSRLHLIARGGSPSWSPDGSRLAFAREGSIFVVRVRHGGSDRFARGVAPTWAPDGRSVAYVGAGHRVYVKRVSGGSPRLLGSVRARSLDWQPLPRSRGVSCARANGIVVASDGRARIRSEFSPSSDAIAWNGCLAGLNRWYHLTGGLDGYGYDLSLGDVALAPPFAALQLYYEDKYDNYSDTIKVFDLRTGLLARSASVPCPGMPCQADQLVADSSGFAAWHATYSVPSFQPLGGVSCPSTSLCVAVGDRGSLATSTDPTDGRSAWSVAEVDGTNALDGVSCPSVSLCVAVDRAGDVVTSTNPTGGASAWTVTHVDSGSSSPAFGQSFGWLDGISCPSVSLCVAVDQAGNAVTSTNPTGGTSAWQVSAVDSAPYGLLHVSCPTVSLCVATDNVGNVATSANPAGGTDAWTKIAVDDGKPLNGVSCPTASSCLAVDSYGDVITSSDPTGGASSWTVRNVDGNSALSDVSCPTSSFCAAPDSAGNVITSTDPTATGATWTAAHVDADNAAGRISCPTATLCVAVDNEGNVITSTNPTGAGNAWTSRLVDAPPCAPSTPCVAENIQAVDTAGTLVIDSTSPGNGTSLANPKLNGDALSWTDSGVARQAQLG